MECGEPGRQRRAPLLAIRTIRGGALNHRREPQVIVPFRLAIEIAKAAENSRTRSARRTPRLPATGTEGGPKSWTHKAHT